MIDATNKGDLNKISSLIKDIDINTVNDYGFTALGTAIGNKDLKTAKFLLEHNGDLPSASHSNLSALDVAVKNSDLEMIKLILEYKAPINSQWRFGQTALMMVDFSKDLDIAKYLVSQGANSAILDDYHKSTQAYIMDAIIESNDIKLTKELIEFLHELRLKETSDDEYLSILTRSYDMDKIKLFFSIDHSFKTGSNRTALDDSLNRVIIMAYCVKEGYCTISDPQFKEHLEVIKFLLEQDAYCLNLTLQKRIILDYVKNDLNDIPKLQKDIVDVFG